jgi:hypothetical protein
MATGITSYMARLQYLEIPVQATLNGSQLVASNAAYQYEGIFVIWIWILIGARLRLRFDTDHSATAQMQETRHTTR